MQKLIQIFSIFFLILFLSACSGEQCIEADDFGFVKFSIPARYDENSLIKMQKDMQVAPWIDTGYVLNGYPLTIVVQNWNKKINKNTSDEVSAWCPWYSSAKDKGGVLSKICHQLPTCVFKNNQMCINAKEAPIGNAPCLLKKGVGLYGLITKGDTNPNISYSTMLEPAGLNFHLGESNNNYELFATNKNGVLEEAGGIVYNYPNNNGQEYVFGKLWFKILDRMYSDNSGQYRVVIKSGVFDFDKDPLHFIINLVKEYLFGKDLNNSYGVVKNIFLNIVNNDIFQNILSALMLLYIAITMISFVIGSISVTKHELLIRIMKITIVSFLLRPGSWEFFYDYLFTFFIDGNDYLITIIQEISRVGSGSTSTLGLLIAPQTMAKLFSLLFVDWRGFIYIILLLIAIYFIFIVTFESYILYLVCLLTTGLIISIFPVMLCFLLFSQTVSLTKNALKQLFSCFLQTVILFTGLAFISFVANGEIYSSLGFRVCKYSFPDLGSTIQDLIGSESDSVDSSLTNSFFYWWFPDPMTGEGFYRKQAVIPVPMAFYDDDGKLCPPYGCNKKRYLEFPFLNPDKPSDQRRISNFFNGNFVQLEGLLLIFITIYLVDKFNSISSSISRFISSTSNNSSNMASISSSAFQPMRKQIDKALAAPAKALDKKLGITRKLQNVKDGISDLASVAYERAMFKNLAKDAISPKRANKAVLSEVKRNYGLDFNDIPKDAIKNYKEALKELLKRENPTLTDKQLKAMSKSLSKMNDKELRDELVKMKFDKSKYSDLDNEQKKNIDNIMKDDYNGFTLREAAVNAKFVRKFQQAYIDAHQDMSARGIGIAGKNSSIVRAYEETKFNVEVKKQQEEKKRKLFGEKLINNTVGKIQETFVSAVVGRKNANKFINEYTGIDLTRPDKRSYDEVLKMQEDELKAKEIYSQINRESNIAGEDITKPEFFARLKRKNDFSSLLAYRDLSDKKIKLDVYAALTYGENPVLMGEKFMKENATEAQLNELISRSYKVQKDFIENDRYLDRKEYYEVGREKSLKNIQEKYDILENHYKRKIGANEVQSLLHEYYVNKGDLSEQEIKKELSNFKQDVFDFYYANDVIEQINTRQQKIIEVFNEARNEINKIKNPVAVPQYKYYQSRKIIKEISSESPFGKYPMPSSNSELTSFTIKEKQEEINKMKESVEKISEEYKNEEEKPSVRLKDYLQKNRINKNSNTYENDVSLEIRGDDKVEKEKSLNEIQERHDSMSDDHNKSEMTEIPSLLSEYYIQKGDVLEKEMKEEISDLKEDINNFDHANASDERENKNQGNKDILAGFKEKQEEINKMKVLVAKPEEEKISEEYKNEEEKPSVRLKDYLQKNRINKNKNDNT